MGQLVGERWRETKKEREIERERRGSETDVPKLYPKMNMYSLCFPMIIYVARILKYAGKCKVRYIVSTHVEYNIRKHLLFFY